MPQVNHGKSEMMSTKKVGVFAVKTKQQSAELVDPGETALAGEAAFIDLRVEEAFPSALGAFAVALVFGNVGNDTVIKADLTSIAGVEGTIGIEESTSDLQRQAFHEAECHLQVTLEVEGVMMIARHDPGRSHNVPVGFGDGQDIAGFGTFAPLVGNAFSAFLGDSVTTVQVQLRQVELVSNADDAALPDPFQTAIRAPFLKMVVNRLPTQLFFSGFPPSVAIGNCAHWQPVCSRYRM